MTWRLDGSRQTKNESTVLGTVETNPLPALPPGDDRCATASSRISGRCGIVDGERPFDVALASRGTARLG